MAMLLNASAYCSHATQPKNKKQKKHASLVMEMKEHHLEKYPVSFTCMEMWSLRLQPTCAVSRCHYCGERETHLFSLLPSLNATFPSFKTPRAAFKLCVYVSVVTLCHTSVLISPGLGADWEPQRAPVGPGSLVLVQAAEDASLQWPADRPKAGCQLCQDDRQPVGSRLNRGEHCVLHLFILSAGGRPDPPWPAAQAVGRDGESSRRKACREISARVRGSVFRKGEEKSEQIRLPVDFLVVVIFSSVP